MVLPLEVAATNQASVRVLHIRELSRMARILPLETPAEADELVREAVISLGWLASPWRVGPLVLQDEVALRIAREAARWDCQAIVLGSRRLRGMARLSGHGVRERVLRLSALPVLVAPAVESNGIHWPPKFRSERAQPASTLGRDAKHRVDDHQIRRAG